VLRALKISVVVMGVMLIAGVIVLIVTIVGRLSRGGSTAVFTGAPIELPAGARIEAMAAGPDRLVIDLLLADGTRQLLILDLATGRQLGTIPLRPAP
jgi:hypothetical protein